jgi:hypothetical protein
MKMFRFILAVVSMPLAWLFTSIEALVFDLGVMIADWRDGDEAPAVEGGEK